MADSELMHHLLAGRAAASRARGRPAGDGAEELSASVFQFREEGGNNLARRRHERRAAPPAGRLALVLQKSERPRRMPARARALLQLGTHQLAIVRSDPAARGPSDGSRNPRGGR